MIDITDIEKTAEGSLFVKWPNQLADPLHMALQGRAAVALRRAGRRLAGPQDALHRRKRGRRHPQHPDLFLYLQVRAQQHSLPGQDRRPGLRHFHRRQGQRENEEAFGAKAERRAGHHRPGAAEAGSRELHRRV